MKILIAALLLTSMACTQQPAPAASAIEGAWMGALDVPPGIKLRVVFHVATSGDGLTATMDSLDQNASGIPVSKVTRNGSTIVFDMPNIGGRFEGQLDNNAATIAGTWSQGGNSFPLTLTRVKDISVLQLSRPQEPKRPYPYRDEDVAYENPAAAGIKLAATLTLPNGKGPFPAAVLITGSGPQDRDEAIMGHKPFLVLADYLTRRGIAVLRADDRGIGKSGGNFATATSADFATDAEAGVAYLKTRREIDPHKIGLIGHSEGGIIAPMVAAHKRDVAFIVLLAGTGIPGDRIVVDQVRMMAAASGMTADKVTELTARHREIVEIFKSEKDEAVFAQKVRERMTGKLSEVEINTAIARSKGPWHRYFIEYDPAPALRKVTCPVLALIGEKDTQVSATDNLPAIRAALQSGGTKDFEVAELPGLNHLFQSAKTGGPSEYGEIEETMSPRALDKIASWIAAREFAIPARK
jgi:pimeloyl-ACP methyl ester carboxylesterase